MGNTNMCPWLTKMRHNYLYKKNLVYIKMSYRNSEKCTSLASNFTFFLFYLQTCGYIGLLRLALAKCENFVQLMPC